jgi:hypothetical protein
MSKTHVLGAWPPMQQVLRVGALGSDWIRRTLISSMGYSVMGSELDE